MIAPSTIIRTLGYTLRKDFKLLVRNWHTILGFMVLPFVLIVLIGFLFGSSTQGSVTVGLDGVNRSILPSNEHIRLIDVNTCSPGPGVPRFDACISKNGSRVQIHVDNSQTNLYAYTLSVLQQAVSQANERSAFNSITVFKDRLQQQVNVLEQTKTQFSSINASLVEANHSIDAMRSGFKTTRASLVEERVQLQDTKAQLDSLKSRYDNQSADIATQLVTLKTQLAELRNNLTRIRPQVPSSYQAQIDQMLSQIDTSLTLIDEVETTMGTVSQSQRIVLAQVDNASMRLDQLLNNFSAYNDQIDQQARFVTALSRTSDSMQAQLANVENGTRSAIGFSPAQLLRSVNANYSLFYTSDIRVLVLPVVIMMILVFLAMVIGSLLTHEELTSPAMVRVELSASPRWLLDLSKIMVVTLVVELNVFLMYLIAMVLWSASFGPRLLLLLAVSVPTIVTFAHLGATLAYLVRRPFLLFVSTTFVAMVFIIASGILRPQELLDPARAVLIALNPATMFLAVTRSGILGSALGWSIGSIAWMLVSFVIVAVARAAWSRTVFRD